MLCQLFEDLNELSMANQELGLVCFEGIVEVRQGFIDEGQMIAAVVWCRHDTWLEDVEQNEWPTGLRSLLDRLVVGDSQISFEPHDIQLASYFPLRKILLRHAV